MKLFEVHVLDGGLWSTSYLVRETKEQAEEDSKTNRLHYFCPTEAVATEVTKIDGYNVRIESNEIKLVGEDK